MPSMTLITDASFAEPGVAGWGSWMKADGRDSTSVSGMIRDIHVNTSNEAELFAVTYGLLAAVLYAPRHDVLLQSDSMHSLRLLKENLGCADRQAKDGLPITGTTLMKLTDNVLDMLEIIRSVRRKQGIQIALRHVKGHREHRGGRHWCNQACDQGARFWMHTARELKAKGGQPLGEGTTVR